MGYMHTRRGRLGLSLLGSLLVASSAATSASLSPLQVALQDVMDTLAIETGLALQLGWRDASTNFSLAAGKYTIPGTTSPKKVTTTDTFLFGSGTKPFISAAVMGLVAKGTVSLDDPVSAHIDKVLNALKPGTSLVGLFGKGASQITVGHVLRMQSGIADFDVPEYDQEVMREAYEKHSPLEFVEYAASLTPKLLFPAGTQVCYSSTNYDIAGFVLLAHAGAGATWDTLNFAQFYPDGVLGNLKFFTDETISQYLTVPGSSGGGWGHMPKATIYNQSSTVLGWSCGNMVGTTGDVANFMWDLLGPEPKVVPAPQVTQMRTFKPLSVGWAKGYISYGTGLMIEASSRTVSFPPTFTALGNYEGHGGDTYGFLSEQGIAYGLNASISVIANSDSTGSFVQGIFMCKVIQTAARVLHGTNADLKCGEHAYQ